MTYITLDELKVELDIADTDQHDARATRSLNAANEMVDAVCRRRFTVDDTAVERTYDLDGNSVVPIDDLSDGDDITVTVNDVETTEYTLKPLNAALDGRPYTHVALDSAVSGTMIVEGKFGWPAVPARVIEATTLLAVRYFGRGDAPFGLVSFGEEAAMRLSRTDPDVYALLVDAHLIRGSAIRSVRLG